MTGLLATTPDADTIRRKTAEVFARPEFNPDNSWLDFGKWLQNFFRWLANLGVTAPFVYWAMLIGCVLLFALLLVLTVRSLMRSATYGAVGKDGVSRAERLRRSAAHFSQAGECSKLGDYTEAIRHLFLALVFRFDEAGRVVLRPGATNREYLILLDERLPERRELSSFVDFLDEFWYAQRPTDRLQYERSLSVYQRLVS
jgi:Domain of unknown function (DUF4129)